MSTSKAIQSIQKQNDAIYSSLISKNIQFDRTIIPDEIDESEHFKLLGEENLRLKEVVKANKPVQPVQSVQSIQSIQVKEEKKKTEQPKQDVKPKEKKSEEDEEDETYEEPVKKFDTITNMEDMKRAFFGGEYGIFEEHLRAHPFKLYKVGYKYNSDKDGVPDFSAKNLLKGFVRNFDDFRKYFMICFRCWKAQGTIQYKYDSYWIVNSNEPIQNIIGSTWEDFEFEPVDDLEYFCNTIKKLSDIDADEPVYHDGYTCLAESYVH